MKNEGNEIFMKVNKYIIYILIFFSIIFVSNNVYADDENEEELNVEDTSWIYKEIEEVNAESINEPNINSRAAVIYDRLSGKVIWGKDETTRRKMASTTKIMTAIVVIENCSNLDEKVCVSKKASGIGGSRLGLTNGAEISVNDLLYGLMLKSGNDCAIALAEYIGGNVESFVDKMNKKAIELNLQDTHFVTVNGLDADDHYTTAEELAKLADYALKNEVFRKIVGTKTYIVMINNNAKTINNTNELLGNLNGVYGVKTGFTNGANRCLVTSIKRDDMDLICVVLGADTKKDRTRDSIKIIEYAFKNYEMVEIKDKIIKEYEKWQKENKIKVIKGINEYLSTEIKDLKIDKIPVLKTKKDKMTIGIESIKKINSPVEINKKVGEIKVKIEDEIILKLDIATNKEIRKKNEKDYFFEMIKKLYKMY